MTNSESTNSTGTDPAETYAENDRAAHARRETEEAARRAERPALDRERRLERAAEDAAARAKRAAEDEEKRRRRVENDRALRETRFPRHAVQEVNDGPLRNAHALGLTGRSGGIDEICKPGGIVRHVGDYLCAGIA